MLQEFFLLKFSNIVRPLTIFLFLLAFSVFTASQTMEKNSETNRLNNLGRTMLLKENNDILDLKIQVCDLPINNGMGGEKSEEPFLPLEILFKILPYFDDITLIQADAVCWSFKVEGDHIWETKRLNLTRKLETPSRAGLDRVKTFAALKNGRYKNICLQHCQLGDMDESSSLMNCKILDLSHNYIQDVGSFCPYETLMHLQELNLSHNSLKGLEKFLSNYSLPALKKLNLSYNGLSQETVIKLRNAHNNPDMLLILEPQIEAPHYSPRAYGGTTTTTFAAWGIKRYK